MDKRLLFLSFLLCAAVLQAKVVPTFQQTGLTCQSVAYNYDSTTIYISAKEAWRGSYDLYTAKLQNGVWSKVVILNNISSPQDELDVAISADEQTLYFTVFTKPEGSKQKDLPHSVIYAARREGNEWLKAEPLAISANHDMKPIVMPDNKTLYFLSARKQSVSEQKTPDKYSIYYSRYISKYDMFTPVPLLMNDTKNEQWTDLEVDASGHQLTYTVQTIQKKDTISSKRTLQLLPQYCLDPVLVLKGNVVDEDAGKPLVANITVFDAVTNKILQRAQSYAQDGSFRLSLPKGRKYYVDFNATNTSHRYFSFDCEQLEADSVASLHVVLASELNLTFYFFDAEWQTPLTVDKTQVTDNSLHRITNIRLQPTEQEGVMKVSLPIGHKYDILIQKSNYKDKHLLLDTDRDVLLTHSEMDIELQHGVTDTRIVLLNATTGERVNGTVEVRNLEQNESQKAAYNKADNCYNILLRQGEQYHLQTKVVGFLFGDTLLAVPSDIAKQDVLLRLTPMEANMTIRLSNIQFETNSYYLSEDSSEELDEIVAMLKKNPTIKVEIAAHTDDIGGDNYNMLLSNRRGESVAKYLIKRGVNKSRITSVGYGKTKPIVPNDSEENRAKNRRVELKITEL